jgi:hypothetical protein
MPAVQESEKYGDLSTKLGTAIAHSIEETQTLVLANEEIVFAYGSDSVSRNDTFGSSR